MFHFLTDETDRRRYAEVMVGAVAPGGVAVLGTFAPAGPAHCSGLPVVRYDAESLSDLFAR